MTTNEAYVMNEGMKMMYQLMYGLDTSKCVPVTADPSTLEVMIDDKSNDILKFLEKTTSVISMDQFSTQDMISGTILFKNKYVDMHRVWGLLKYDSKPFGFMDRTDVYNGFPTLIDPAKFVVDPAKSFDEAMQKMLSDQELFTAEMQATPKTYSRVSLFILKDFYEQHIKEKKDGK